MTPAMRVVEELAAEVGISSKDILGKSRLGHIVLARREAMRRLYLLKRMNTPAIALLFDTQATSVRHHLRAAGIKGCRSRMELAGME